MQAGCAGMEALECGVPSKAQGLLLKGWEKPMARVAILVPFAEMRELTKPLLTGISQHVTVICLEYIRTEAAAARARELELQGCELIIARGSQASIIKQTVKLPLVEIVVTTQELGLIVMQLKEELERERPRIGLIGFANMLGDTTHFNTLFGIELHTYMIENSDELRGAVELAQRDGCDAVIGGDTVCEEAARLGLPSRFIPAGEESVRNALEIASSVCYAIDIEKKNSAEMDTMLNYTFSGIMQVDSQGIVQRINRAGYDLLEQIPGELLGRHVTKVIPNFNQKVLDDTLQLGKEAYAFVLDLHNKAAVINLAPIRVDGVITGALLTFQEGKRIIEMDSELRRELYQRGYIAKYSFEKLPAGGREAEALARLGRRIAKYSAPVLLTGEEGVGKSILAQCIHNESLARTNAFVPLDCSAWLPETLDTMLFGNYTTRKDSPACMAELARDGTLFLSHVEALPFETQYKLLSLVQGKFMHNGSNRPVGVNVRVIAASSVNLPARVERGEFRSDLYYALSVLSMEVPPLRRRRDDILPWMDHYLTGWQESYKRYIHLTQGARQYLLKYDWPGNLNQLDTVCQRIVLLTEKRNIDETFLRAQLEQVAPKLLPGTEKVVLYKDQKAVHIAELLRQYGGNREKVAAELGVSKTTLWRYIKKYGIEADFSY